MSQRIGGDNDTSYGSAPSKAEVKLRHVTIRQLSGAVRQPGGKSYIGDTGEFTIVVIVGNATLLPADSLLKFRIEDGTGSIIAKLLSEGEEPPAFKAAFPYVRIFGTLDSFKGVISIIIRNIEEVRDAYEVYHHCLQAIFETVAYERGPPPSDVMAQPQATSTQGRPTAAIEDVTMADTTMHFGIEQTSPPPRRSAPLASDKREEVPEAETRPSPRVPDSGAAISVKELGEALPAAAATENPPQLCTEPNYEGDKFAFVTVRSPPRNKPSSPMSSKMERWAKLVPEGSPRVPSTRGLFTSTSVRPSSSEERNRAPDAPNSPAVSVQKAAQKPSLDFVSCSPAGGHAKLKSVSASSSSSGVDTPGPSTPGAAQGHAISLVSSPTPSGKSRGSRRISNHDPYSELTSLQRDIMLFIQEYVTEQEVSRPMYPSIGDEEPWLGVSIFDIVPHVAIKRPNVRNKELARSMKDLVNKGFLTSDNDGQFYAPGSI
ncbi:hypothetical protein BDN72DRAFT_227161 [Pluteus cervinus]|uniref:Uncharacterized protein n=1 Tax=Pluteus cervinus TaxID=181527 RepID=A0ACD3BDV5_9AGAR|nr:hypothetical protein BDN72DRAFT_227161 [Pluteus cervinus]